MAPPKKPSDPDVKTLFFSNPNDLTEAIALEVVDTGNTTSDGNKIFRMSVGSGGGPIPVLPAALVPNPPIVLTGGAAEQLPTLALVNGINMKSASGNNAAGIWIGADNTVAINNGYLLLPGSGIPIEVQNMDAVWVFGTVGDILYYLGG